MSKLIMPYNITKKECEKEHRMQYKDLDLKKIRVVADLDFAHYTYGKDQCSCCYGPRDMPVEYWKNGKVSDEANIEYILFKNSYNGSGTVTENDYLAEKQNIYIGWHIESEEKLNKVIRMLREQVGREFIVSKPKDIYTCIILKRRNKIKETKNE